MAFIVIVVSVIPAVVVLPIRIPPITTVPSVRAWLTGGCFAVAIGAIGSDRSGWGFAFA